MDLTKRKLFADILIVDDEPSNIKLLELFLQRKGYLNVHSTSDSRKVKALCSEIDFDVILLDIRMPYIDGYGVMDILKTLYKDNFMPVMVLTAQVDKETRLKALKSGAKDFLTKPFDFLEVETRINNLLEVRLMHKEIHDQNKILEAKVKIRTGELYATRLEVIRRLGLAAEFRDNETGNHVIRMSKYSQILALAHGLSEQHAELILNAAPMHDIGKIGICDKILLKPGKLNADERKIMKTHVDIGVEILSGSDSKLMQVARIIAMHHHEKWDGSGYPAGLKGEEISIEGRICALADVFDALVSKRCYKQAWQKEAALSFIEKQSGKHFDPQLVSLIPKILPEINIIQGQHADV